MESVEKMCQKSHLGKDSKIEKFSMLIVLIDKD
jgi:hypothetical protein